MPESVGQLWTGKKKTSTIKLVPFFCMGGGYGSNDESRADGDSRGWNR